FESRWAKKLLQRVLSVPAAAVPFVKSCAAYPPPVPHVNQVLGGSVGPVGRTVNFRSCPSGSRSLPRPGGSRRRSGLLSLRTATLASCPAVPSAWPLSGPPSPLS